MIPLSVPNISGNEWNYIKECLDTNWVSSVGSYVDKFEKKITEYTGAKYAISTVNGTAALHISLILSEIGSEDCVLVPNITFIASLNSICYTGAEPILIDIDKNNWQMDIQVLENYLSEKTILRNNKCYRKTDGKRIKAIMPVHVLGNMIDMISLIELAEKYYLTVIEDSTEALGSFYKSKHSGTFGKFGCFSFNGNKILTTGGGGMIITDDEKLAIKAKHLTTQAKSDSYEYIHDEVGYNYRMVNVLAAMGVAQMEKIEEFLIRKKEIADFYYNKFQSFDIQYQNVLSDANPNNWLYTIFSENKEKLEAHLLKNNIQVRPLWKPMNQLNMFSNLEFVAENNISSYIYKGCLSLPCSTGIKNEELEEVAHIVSKFYK